jgi:hypothetical protein
MIAELALQLDDTGNLPNVAKLQPQPDDPTVCVPATRATYRLHRKRATVSMPSPLISATGNGHRQPRRADQRDARADPKAGLEPDDCPCPPVRHERVRCSA